MISEGSLNKSGSGTLTLSGTNTYSGSTTITNGTLVFQVQLIWATQVADGDNIIFNGGTLRLQMTLLGTIKELH